MSERRALAFGPLPALQAPEAAPPNQPAAQRAKRWYAPGYGQVVSLEVRRAPLVEVTMFGDAHQRYITADLPPTAVVRIDGVSRVPYLGEAIRFSQYDASGHAYLADAHSLVGVVRDVACNWNADRIGIDVTLTLVAPAEAR